MLKNPNRSVVQTGNGALSISLPSEWVEANDIKKGDLIMLTEEPAGLLLTKVI